MLTRIELKFGSAQEQPPLALELPPSVTIFVGANNSGKSLLLREIHRFCREGDASGNSILGRLMFAADDAEVAHTDIERLSLPPFPGEQLSAGMFLCENSRHGRTRLSREQYIAARTQPNAHPRNAASWHVDGWTLSLDGAERVRLLQPQARGDLTNPKLPLARLYVSDAKRTNLRRIVHNAIGLHIGIDAFSADQVQIHFGDTPPVDERSYNDAALDWVRSARKLDQVSDGVKAFTGIMLQVYAGDPKIIIVDEPEAFLHPSLSHQLGRELASAAVRERKHIFAATHSAQFVMGAIQSGASVNIVRLAYDGVEGTARLLSSVDLSRLMMDPLLRSVGVINALFFQNVIVTEADADRAFYEEINHRLIVAGDARGISHALFLNADGKATIPKIVEPLRKLGIPTAAIVDVDLVKDGGEVYTRHLRASFYPSDQLDASQNHRLKVLASLEKAAPEGENPREYFKRHGGLSLLSEQELESAENFCDALAQYGYFIVKIGEVERWLPALDVPRKKQGSQSWRATIFGAMGSDPNDDAYVKPSSGDVWDFVGNIGSWCRATRRGIPV